MQMGDIGEGSTEVLTSLEQFRLGNNKFVVEVSLTPDILPSWSSARSTERAIALSNYHPTLHFIVQMSDSLSGSLPKFSALGSEAE
jgi:hypothetical protein